jgi:hypothetical protein
VNKIFTKIARKIGLGLLFGKNLPGNLKKNGILEILEKILGKNCGKDTFLSEIDCFSIKGKLRIITIFRIIINLKRIADKTIYLGTYSVLNYLKSLCKESRN